MVSTSQIDYLMDDLKSIDDFFKKQDYHRWGKDVESHREGLQKGFELLSKYPCTPESPTLSYNNLLAYGEEPESGHGNKRFFVNVQIWTNPNAYNYSYNITIRSFHDKVDQPSDVERLDRYFTTPVEHRGNQPLQKMLTGLERLL